MASVERGTTSRTGAPGAPLAVFALYSPQDVLDHLWRQRLVMLCVFLGVLGCGAAATFLMKPTYQARSSLLVRLGQEYVYQPGVGDAAKGVTPDNDQIVQSELEILSSAALKARVIHDIGYGRLFPGQGGAYAAASDVQRRKMDSAAIHSLETGLKIVTAPDNAVVRMTYSSPDPELAATVLNTLIDEYLVYRRTVLGGGDLSAVAEQKRGMDARLRAADEAYNQFLSDNHIGDFETEKASLAASYGQLVAESYSVDAQLSETQGNLAATSRLASQAPAEIGLYRDLDHTASDRLAQLKLERQEMASRYQPGAQPLKDKDAQIAALEGLVAAAANPAAAGGVKRMGVNPIWQSLQTERNQMESRAASLRSRKSAIARELDDLTERRRKLSALEPQYQALSRDRDILATNLRALATRAQELEAQQSLQGKLPDNIKIVERAYVPAQGVSLKAPVLAFSILLGGFSAICVGLVGLVTQRGYPSRAAVERSLGVPVMGEAPAYH